MRIFHYPLIIAVAVPASAQTSPAIDMDSLQYKYRAVTHSLSRVVFEESTIRIESKSFRLHKGQYKRYSRAQGGLEYYLKHSWFIPSPNGTPRFALIDIMELKIGGSSAATEYVQLLELEGSHLVLKQEFRFNPSGAEAPCSFDPKSGSLVLVAKSDCPSSDVFPKSLDTATYAWSGNQFKISKWSSSPIEKNRKVYEDAP